MKFYFLKINFSFKSYESTGKAKATYYITAKQKNSNNLIQMSYLVAFPSVIVPMLLGLSFHDVQNSICITYYGHRYLHTWSYLLF